MLSAPSCGVTSSCMMRMAIPWKIERHNNEKNILREQPFGRRLRVQQTRSVLEQFEPQPNLRKKIPRKTFLKQPSKPRLPEAQSEIDLSCVSKNLTTSSNKKCRCPFPATDKKVFN